MQQTEIALPGTLTSTAGLDRLLSTNNGFPDDLLASLYLFADGSGTAPANSVSGGAAATIESLVSSNNAYSWETGGGGVHLEGGQIVSMPAIDITQPWTIVSGGMVVGSVADGTTRDYQLLSFKCSATNNFRGAFGYLDGGTTWNPPAGALNYILKVSNGSGGVGSGVTTTPGSSTTAINTGRMKLLSFNGVDTITFAVYDKNGALLQIATATTTPTNLKTGSGGVVQTNVQPMIGPWPSALYCGGKQNVEAAAVYKRTLTNDDIVAICAAMSALGTARGRAW